MSHGSQGQHWCPGDEAPKARLSLKTISLTPLPYAIITDRPHIWKQIREKICNMQCAYGLLYSVSDLQRFRLVFQKESMGCRHLNQWACSNQLFSLKMTPLEQSAFRKFDLKLVEATNHSSEVCTRKRRLGLSWIGPNEKKNPNKKTAALARHLLQILSLKAPQPPKYPTP